MDMKYPLPYPHQKFRPECQWTIPNAYSQGEVTKFQNEA